MTDVPRDPEGFNDEADAELDDLDEDENPDTRSTQRRWDARTEKDGELSESEDEDMNTANGVAPPSKSGRRKNRRNIMDFQNPLASSTAMEDVLNSGAASARSGRSQANGLENDRSEMVSENEGDVAANGDEDVEMADAEGRAANGAEDKLATPPDSPRGNGEVEAVEETVAQSADVGDEKEVGREEREIEDVGAEKKTEVAERREAD